MNWVDTRIGVRTSRHFGGVISAAFSMSVANAVIRSHICLWLSSELIVHHARGSWVVETHIDNPGKCAAGQLACDGAVRVASQPLLPMGPPGLRGTPPLRGAVGARVPHGILHRGLPLGCHILCLPHWLQVRLHPAILLESLARTFSPKLCTLLCCVDNKDQTGLMYMSSVTHCVTGNVCTHLQ